MAELHQTTSPMGSGVALRKLGIGLWMLFAASPGMDLMGSRRLTCGLDFVEGEKKEGGGTFREWSATYQNKFE